MAGTALSDGVDEGFRVTKSIQLTAPLPVTAAGGRVGLSALRDRIEIGAETAVFWIPPGNAAFGLSVGGRLQFAPIPGRWGRRFTLAGNIFRAFAHGRPSFDALGFGAALGYRHPIGGMVGRVKWIFLEMGVERDFLYTYNDVLLTPRLTAGFGF